MVPGSWAPFWSADDRSRAAVSGDRCRPRPLLLARRRGPFAVVRPPVDPRRVDAEDVSLTYVAARREVVRRDGAGSRVVGENIFEVLEREMSGDGSDVHWVGYFGYACPPDLPAVTDPCGGCRTP